MRTWILIGCMGVAALALAAGRMATGQGGLATETDSVATVNFSIPEGNLAKGHLLFAADGGHDYPDTIVSLEGFSSARFSGRQVVAEGRGMILDEHATIEIKAWDGAGTARPDRFSIKATADDGHVFEMSFALNVGDIAIRSH